MTALAVHCDVTASLTGVGSGAHRVSTFPDGESPGRKEQFKGCWFGCWPGLSSTCDKSMAGCTEHGGEKQFAARISIHERMIGTAVKLSGGKGTFGKTTRVSWLSEVRSHTAPAVAVGGAHRVASLLMHHTRTELTGAASARNAALPRNDTVAAVANGPRLFKGTVKVVAPLYALSSGGMRTVEGHRRSSNLGCGDGDGEKFDVEEGVTVARVGVA